MSGYTIRCPRCGAPVYCASEDNQSGAMREHRTWFCVANRCAVDGCDRRSRARGMCDTHYRRWRAWGFAGPAEMLRPWGRDALRGGTDSGKNGGDHNRDRPRRPRADEPCRVHSRLEEPSRRVEQDASAGHRTAVGIERLRAQAQRVARDHHRRGRCDGNARHLGDGCVLRTRCREA